MEEKLWMELGVKLWVYSVMITLVFLNIGRFPG